VNKAFSPRKARGDVLRHDLEASLGPFEQACAADRTGGGGPAGDGWTCAIRIGPLMCHIISADSRFRHGCTQGAIGTKGPAVSSRQSECIEAQGRAGGQVGRGCPPGRLHVQSAERENRTSFALAQRKSGETGLPSVC